MKRLSKVAVAAVVAAGLAASYPLPASAAPPRCHGFPATMVGTEDPDTLIGTPKRDVIVGLGELDTIRGRGGNDVLCGGDNPEAIAPDGSIVTEKVFGGAGNDLVEGGPGPDRLRGDVGKDRLFGGSDDDLLIGGRGADSLLAAAGNDDLTDHRGDNTLAGGMGVDALEGGPGDELLKGGSGPDRLLPQAGRDVVRGGLGQDAADYSIEYSGGAANDNPNPVVVDLASGDASGMGRDTLVGLEGVYGGLGADKLRGTDEANFFFPGPQTRSGESIRGRGGLDVLYFEHFDVESYAGVEVDLAEGTARTRPGGSIEDRGTSSVLSIADVIGTRFDDVIEGSAGQNTLQGAFDQFASGADEMRGRGGRDLIFGFDGHDDLFGGPGDDALDGHLGDDHLDGNGGTNENYGGDGIDTCLNPAPPDPNAHDCEN